MPVTLLRALQYNYHNTTQYNILEYNTTIDGLSTQTFILAEHLDFQHGPLCWPSIWTFNTDVYAG